MNPVRAISGGLFGLAIAMLLVPAEARAFGDDCPVVICEMAPKPFWHVDKRIKVADDCSFENAGDGWGFHLDGNAAKDIGGGRVGQRWITSGCGLDESIVVADCNTMKAIEVVGTCAADHSGVSSVVPQRSSDLLFPPEGKLVLTSATTLSRVSNMADRHGYRTHTGVVENQMSRKKRNRIDVFCGCKLFYPDTAGARK